MINLELAGKKYVISFKHKPQSTVAYLAEVTDKLDEKGRPVLKDIDVGESLLHPNDNYDKFIGAKVAVEKLAQNYAPNDKLTRQKFMDAFYDRDYRGHIQRKLDRIIRDLTRPVALEILQDYVAKNGDVAPETQQKSA